MMAEIVEEFEHKGHKCVIRKISFPTMEEFHNGYIKVADSKKEIRTKEREALGREVDVTYEDFVSEIETDALTVSGELPGVDGYFFGFDSGHFWNEENPESQTLSSVRQRTKEMVEEFEEKKEEFKRKMKKIRGRGRGGEERGDRSYVG